MRPLLKRRAVFYGHLAAYAVASLLLVLSLYQLPPFSSQILEVPKGVQIEGAKELRPDLEKLREKAMPAAPKQELPTAYAIQPRRPRFPWAVSSVILWGALVLLHGVLAFKRAR